MPGAVSGSDGSIRRPGASYSERTPNSPKALFGEKYFHCRRRIGAEEAPRGIREVPQRPYPPDPQTTQREPFARRAFGKKIRVSVAFFSYFSLNILSARVPHNLSKASVGLADPGSGGRSVAGARFWSF